MQVFWKWYLKNKDGIWIATIAGLLVLAIYQIIASLIATFKTVKIPTNEILRAINAFINYNIKISFTVSVFSIISSLLIVIISFILFKKIKIKNILSKSKLEILKATYGTDKKQVNITQELNMAIADNKLSLLLTNNIAGDPDVGTQKIGKIFYKFEGKKLKKEVIENSLIELP